jgi:serine/threonine protein kinase
LSKLSKDSDTYGSVIKIHDSFTVSSQHGEHEVLVTEPLIGELEEYHRSFERKARENNDKYMTGWLSFAKKAVYKLLKTLEVLHSKNITHGDLSLTSLMLRLKEPLDDESLGDIPQPDKEDDEETSKDENFFWLKKKEDEDDVPDYLARKIRLEHQNPDLMTAALNRPLKLVLSGFSCASTENSSNHLGYTQRSSLHFRPPERYLGMPITTKSDIWAFGCLVYYVISNSYFIYHKSEGNENAYLQELTSAIGPMPKDFLDKWEHSSKYVDEDGDLLHDENSEKGFSYPHEMAEAEKIHFNSFIACALDWEPEERWEARKLLRHPWILDYVQHNNESDDEGEDDESDDDEGDERSDDSPSNSSSDESDDDEAHSHDGEASFKGE